MHRIVTAITLSILAALPALAAGKAESKKTSADTKPRTAATIEPFKERSGGLPPGYEGTNAVRLYEVFSSKTSSIKKGEFETTEDFNQRIANKEALLAPLSTSALYAFKLRSVEIKYDADREVYELGARFMHPCSSTSESFSDSTWITCDVATISTTRDTYKGSNAYGASRTVERYRGKSFAVAIRKEHPVFETQLVRHNAGRFDFSRTLSVPLDKAKSIKNQIGVLMVGTIADAKIITGRPTLISPTIDSPTDIFTTVDAAPIDLKELIIYVIPTGEILERNQY